MTIHMPPLRRRREDIPALVRYLLADICEELDLPGKTVSTQATELLAALPWRRNVLELQDLLRTLAVQTPGRLIRLADILARVELEGGSAQPTFEYTGTLKQARARFERDYVAAVLEQHHGRMGEAAKALGIQRTNLYRKVRQLSVKRRAAGTKRELR
jgi:two-component system, NtrC family, nitrogen regulation response regulator NtrX